MLGSPGPRIRPAAFPFRLLDDDDDDVIVLVRKFDDGAQRIGDWADEEEEVVVAWRAANDALDGLVMTADSDWRIFAVNPRCFVAQEDALQVRCVMDRLHRPKAIMISYGRCLLQDSLTSNQAIFLWWNDGAGRAASTSLDAILNRLQVNVYTLA
jgi:hypothetical protein